MRLTTGATVFAVMLFVAGPAAAERIFLSCSVTYPSTGQSADYTVVVDTDRYEVAVNGTLFTRSGNPRNGRDDDGSVWTALDRVWRLDAEVVSWGTAVAGAQTTYTISRITGQITGPYSAGTCKRVTGRVF